MRVGPKADLDTNALGRGVEDTNAKAADAGAPNADFSSKSQSGRAARFLRTGIGTHARVGNTKLCTDRNDKVRNGRKGGIGSLALQV